MHQVFEITDSPVNPVFRKPSFLEDAFRIKRSMVDQVFTLGISLPNYLLSEFISDICVFKVN